MKHVQRFNVFHTALQRPEHTEHMSTGSLEMLVSDESLSTSLRHQQQVVVVA